MRLYIRLSVEFRPNRWSVDRCIAGELLIDDAGDCPTLGDCMTWHGTAWHGSDSNPNSKPLIVIECLLQCLGDAENHGGASCQEGGMGMYDDQLQSGKG